MTEEIKLHTERLIVRSPRVEDAQDVFTLMKDKNTAMITGFTPMSNISEAEGKIRRGISGGNMFVITTEEKPGHAIGVFEVTSLKVSNIHGEKQEYEICYFLHKDFRGKGYMTEVVESMKRYLFMERQADTLIISVFPRNDASRRVAIKNGFIFKNLERKCGITGCGEIALASNVQHLGWKIVVPNSYSSNVGLAMEVAVSLYKADAPLHIYDAEKLLSILKEEDFVRLVLDSYHIYMGYQEEGTVYELPWEYECSDEKNSFLTLEQYHDIIFHTEWDPEKRVEPIS